MSRQAVSQSRPCSNPELWDALFHQKYMIDGQVQYRGVVHPTTFVGKCSPNKPTYDGATNYALFSSVRLLPRRC